MRNEILYVFRWIIKYECLNIVLVVFWLIKKIGFQDPKPLTQDIKIRHQKD